MALTVENIGALPYRVIGAQRKSTKKVTFDNSYQSEGEPLTFKELGLSYVESADVSILNGSENESEFPVSSGYYTPSTEKIHLINAKTSKEVASTKNVEKVVAQVEAYGW